MRQVRSVPCPTCGERAGSYCRSANVGRPYGRGHAARRRSSGVDADGLTNTQILKSMNASPRRKVRKDKR